MDHAIHYFVNGSITSGRQNQISAVADAIARDGGCRLWAGCGQSRNPVPLAAQRLNGTLEKLIALAIQLAGEWIINKVSVLVGRDNPLNSHHYRFRFTRVRN
jgi:hypothetical protein